MFLSATSFARYLFYETDELLNRYQNKKYDYVIRNISQEEVDEVINYLDKGNLIKEHIVYRLRTKRYRQSTNYNNTK